MKVIVFANNADGTGVGILTPVTGTDGKALDDMIKETLQGKYGVRIIEHYEIPEVPLALLGALKMNVELKVVGVDLEKAKDIWRDEWRAARAPLLAKLDVDYIRALERVDSEEMFEVAAKKQALRDVTNTPINVFSAQDVVKVWPAILNG